MSEQRGSLHTQPLPHLLMEIYRARASGLLSLEAAGGRSTVRFHQGYPVAVTSPGLADQLGQILLEARFIDEATYQRQLTELAAQPGLLGHKLVAVGLITETQLAEALKIQLRRRLYRLFFLERGGWSFVDGSAEGQLGDEGLHIQPRRAIYQGIRSAWSPARARAAVAHLEGHPLRLTIDASALARFGLAEADAAIAGAFAHGPVTISQVAAAIRQPIEAVRAMACVFHFCGALESSSPVVEPHGTLTDAPSAGPAGGPAVAPPPPAALMQATPYIGVQAVDELVAEAAHGPPPAVLKPAAAKAAAPPVAGPKSAPASPAAGPRAAAAAPDVSALRQQVAAKLAAIGGDDLFTILGVPESASKEQLKSAYITAAKQFHPDRFTGPHLGGFRQDADKIFRRLNEAYSTLSDDERRKTYLAKRAQPKLDKAEEAKARAIVEAELSFRQGEVLMKKRDYANAVTAFARAVELGPEEGEHRAWLAWAQVAAGQRPLADIRGDLQGAVAKSEKCARAHYFLGVVYKEEGQLDKAASCFRKATELDTRLVEAASEYRLVTLRREKQKQEQAAAPKGGSLLDRLRRK